jgi:hypothetical protein
MWMDAACGVMPSSRAARLKLPSCTMRMKVLMARRLSMRSLRVSQLPGGSCGS